MKAIVYTTPTCPNCKVLERFLNELGVEYEEKNMLDLDVQTELIMMDVFTTSAPILRVGDKFLTIKELFNGGKLNVRLIKDVLGVEGSGWVI